MNTKTLSGEWTPKIADGATKLEATPANELIDEVLKRIRRGDQEPAVEQQAAVKPLSGLYRRAIGVDSIALAGIDDPVRAVAEAGLGAAAANKEELRVDVDGRYPLNVVSGTLTHSLSMRVEWIARLTKTGPSSWTGTVSYKNGDVGLFPYTALKMDLARDGAGNPRGASVEYSGGGQPTTTRIYKYADASFHVVELEFDNVAGATAALQFDTGSHPHRPATLPNESLSIQEVFTRAGFRVNTSMNTSAIPAADAGGDGVWSDAEMHDAMQTYWSRFASKAQWAAWILHAPLHEEGESLGGIMFDDIGPNHRQGTAVFTDSFIADPPAGDPAPQAWVNRMRFWCAIHEMGHQFNLAHSWQKALGAPWIPQVNRPHASSFMNYPFRAPWTPTSFFNAFEYRFDDDELLFMRHAPERFVEMGNAAWFDNHGFRRANLSEEPALALELRVNRERPAFEYLEPVVVELKLTNVSANPLLIDQRVLADLDHFTIVIQRRGDQAKQFLPFARRCWSPAQAVLLPNESKYESIFLSAGRAGWYIAEPGVYTVQLALHLEERDEDVVSNPLELRVVPAPNREQEILAQDYFTEGVGRVLAFDGSRILDDAVDTLKQVVDEAAETKAALHARVALGLSAARPFKTLELDGTFDYAAAASSEDAKIVSRKSDAKEARQYLEPVLLEENPEAAATLGNIDYHAYARQYGSILRKQDKPDEASEVLENAYSVMQERKVKSAVLDELRNACEAYAEETKHPKKKR